MFGLARRLRELRSSAIRYCGTEGGNVALLFALSLPVLVGVIGMAIDFSRGADARVKLAAALDAAVLAAAEKAANGETDITELQTVAQSVFEANVASIERIYDRAPAMTLTRDPDSFVLVGTADASVDHALFLTGTGGSSDIRVSSEAAYATLDIELAMMLDVTGSMRGGKLRDLQEASHTVIDALLGADAGPVRDRVRIALVPYSAAVNAGAYAEEVTGEPGARCVVERDGSGGYTDVSPRIDPIETHPNASCPGQEIEALTNRADVLRAAIDDFTASGCTAGHLGISWAYYTLSPRWNQIWPVESQPVDYEDDETLKVAVLMTDGEFNTYYHDVGDPTCSGAARTQSRRVSEQLCDEMRNDNIRIYAVAFQAPSSAERLLRSCADDDARYYEAENGDELAAAFAEIASEIRNLRLTQ